MFYNKESDLQILSSFKTIPIQLLFFILVNVFSTSVTAIPSDIKLDIENLTNRDMKLESSSNKLCDELGEEYCNLFKTGCKATPTPNVCFQRGFLFYSIDIQVCGQEKAKFCLEERFEYEQKLQNFVEKYASNSGLGRAALNVCYPFFEVEPQSEKLVEIQKRLNTVMDGIGKYVEQKKLYECIKQKYLDSINDLL